MLLSILAVAFSLALAGCRGPGDALGTPPSSGTPANGANSSPASPNQSVMTPLPASARLFASPASGYSEPTQVVIGDAASWAGAWQNLHQGMPADPAPGVDFATHVVVLVGTGTRNTGGHEITVEGTSPDAAGGLVVHVKRTMPGRTCMTTQALGAPTEAVRVPRPAGAVRFVTRDVVTDC